MQLSEKDLMFDFRGALSAVHFDEDSQNEREQYENAPAVDFIVERNNHYVFVEVKDPDNPGTVDVQAFIDKMQSGELVKSLSRKYRESFLFRSAQDRLDKPVHYRVLIGLRTLDAAHMVNLTDKLKKHVPSPGPGSWQREIAQSCLILNIESWNRTFPKSPITRISGQPL